MRPEPEFETVTGTVRHSVWLLSEAESWPYMNVAEAVPFGALAAVVFETGFGVLAETPRAAAEEGARDGVGDVATALGLTEADGVGLESADALALALAATEDTECATAAVFPVPAPAHAVTLAASTTAPAPATAAVRSRDPLLNTRPSPT